MNYKLYLWNNWHNGDIITTIPLIWEIHKQIKNATISVGCFNNHAYLFEGCPIKELFIANINDGDGPNERYNFSSMCPKDNYDIYTWLGQYHDTRAHTWENQVEVFNRKCYEKNIPIKLNNFGVPDIIFPRRKLNVPKYPKSVWVENGICRSGHNEFIYNMDKIGKLFPDFHFFTTSLSQCNNPNVTDCSRLNLIELSNLSNECDIILGKGSGPYFTTFTNKNIGKPRAIVGFNLRTHLPFWDNQKSIIKYLLDEKELIYFLRYNKTVAMKTEIDEIFKNFTIHDYKNIDLRKKMVPEISKTVNQFIPKIASNHDLKDEVRLKNDGYVIFNNFLSKEECETIKNNLTEQGGYNTHVPIYSDNILRKFSPDYPFNTLSYPPTSLLNISLILKKISDPLILSLAQSYLGCFPTLYSLNSWWHIYKDQVYGTQSNHRDHDDFRFLALFIYLTDVDETNGPHVFYPKTQDGSETNNSISIIGKAGTAILADTFAIHRGQPLQQGTRLVCWWRYGLHLNNMHFHDGNNNYKIFKEKLFETIPKTPHNEYIFRAFYE